MTGRSEEKKIIGRIEKVGFPEWGLSDIDAKTDTGAFTSSLHCHHISLSPDRTSVTFYILDPTHPEFENRTFTCDVSDIRSIRSSNGLSEERIIVSTLIELSGIHYNIELSLTDRSEMRHAVLLGRKFLRKRFIVDVSKKYTGKKR